MIKHATTNQEGEASRQGYRKGPFLRPSQLRDLEPNEETAFHFLSLPRSPSLLAPVSRLPLACLLLLLLLTSLFFVVWPFLVALLFLGPHWFLHSLLCPLKRHDP